MESEDNITCKVVLVGDAGVGKTSIIQRYLSNTYSENLPSTSTASYSYKVIEYKKYNKSISFDIWDTAGQEIYRSIAKNFYVNASIGILVYDIRNKLTFESIKNYWHKQLKDSGEEKMVIGIAGNKSDLFEDEEVSEKEAENFAQSVGAIFQLTSCKNNVGIDDLFEKCGEKYLENNQLIDNNTNKANEGKGKVKLNLDNNKGNNNGKNNKKKCC